MERFFRSNLAYMELKSLEIANTTLPNCTGIYLLKFMISKTSLNSQIYLCSIAGERFITVKGNN